MSGVSFRNSSQGVDFESLRREETFRKIVDARKKRAVCAIAVSPGGDRICPPQSA